MKKSDKIDKVDRVDNNKSDERYQIQKNQINLIRKNQKLMKDINIQEPREDDGIEDTDTELEHGPQQLKRI